MIPTDKQITALLEKYAPNDEYLELVTIHGQVVAEIALWCADNIQEKVDSRILDAACRLHDIGSYVFIGAANYSDDFERSYPGHAILGAKILQDEGIDERIWRAVETHVLMGLSAGEIESVGFALPHRDYIPQTIEAELLCYADRFHSKHPTFNDFETFRTKLTKELPKQAARMQEFADRFGLPDITALAKKYEHPIR